MNVLHNQKDFKYSNSVIVIPIYKNILSDFEKASLQQCNDVFYKDYEIVILSDNFEKIKGIISTYNFSYLLSEKRYEEIQKEFNDLFPNNRFLLVYDLNSWVFFNQIPYFINYDYDKLGEGKNVLIKLKKKSTKNNLPINKVISKEFSSKELTNPLPFIWESPIEHSPILEPYNKDKIAICCIAKYENDYIREFVEYYKKIGADNIILYDNNDIDGESFNDVIEDYIKDGFVQIFNYRGQPHPQLKAYNHCYDKFRNKYKWIGFLDIDEFIILEKHNTLKEFLSQEKFNGFDLVRLNWQCYGDNDLIGDENDYDRSLLKRFTKPLYEKYYQNGYTKFFIRTDFDKIFINNPHSVLENNKIKSCDTCGNETNANSMFQKNIESREAYIKHFLTKTIIEFSQTKYIRGSVYGKRNTNYTFRNFFTLNTPTDKKIKIAKKYGYSEISD